MVLPRPRSASDQRVRHDGPTQMPPCQELAQRKSAPAYWFKLANRSIPCQGWGVRRSFPDAGMTLIFSPAPCRPEFIENHGQETQLEKMMKMLAFSESLMYYICLSGYMNTSTKSIRVKKALLSNPCISLPTGRPRTARGHHPLTNDKESRMEEIVRHFKAFSDETRLRVLHLLLKGELCICELMEVLQLTQSKVSRHMAYLKNAGLVTDRREGVWIYYSLVRPKNKIHASQLRCLAECFEDDEVLKRDTERFMALRQEKTQTSPLSQESPEDLPVELL